MCNHYHDQETDMPLALILKHSFLIAILLGNSAQMSTQAKNVHLLLIRNLIFAQTNLSILRIYSFGVYVVMNKHININSVYHKFTMYLRPSEAIANILKINSRK